MQTLVQIQLANPGHPESEGLGSLQSDQINYVKLYKHYRLRAAEKTTHSKATFTPLTTFNQLLPQKAFQGSAFKTLAVTCC